VLGNALFQDPVQFARLGFVVVDEQQRFGVEQRLKLVKKGTAPHLLFLSATPIPRTFELALLGNLDVSYLTKSHCQSRIKTYLISMNKISDIETYIHKCLSKEERVYWVCPLIDGKDQQDGSALDEGVKYRAEVLMKKFSDSVGILHGKMTSRQKQNAVEQFRLGTKPILVATTVIEVGVHVPEATTMIIEQSERFGLSQIHQIRGRVGRGAQHGHCFLLHSQNISIQARQRMRALRECSDGAEIAEKDWQLRGGGDLVGTLQSGFSRYRFVDLSVHHTLMKLAEREAMRLWESSIQCKKANPGDCSPLAMHHYVPLLLRMFSWHHDGILCAG